MFFCLFVFCMRCVLLCSAGSYNAVKAVERGIEVGLSAQAIQFYKHLS